MASPHLDPLYCQEQHHHWESDDDDTQNQEPNLLISPSEQNQWPQILSTLFSKEQETHPQIPKDTTNRNHYLYSARQEPVSWVLLTCAQHGFSALTAMLAVSYLDRCFLLRGGLQLQADRPWMQQLSAVACLSIAAKVEETHVPLLLDLQSGGARYVFEAKTVRRMELLVLSLLGWRMNSVTPLSFIQHMIIRDNGGTSSAAAIALRRCEGALLSVIADWRWVMYWPSVWAAATLMQAMGQTLEPGYCESSHILALLGLTKESVEGCYEIISNSMNGGMGNKRKHTSASCYLMQCCSPSSPNGVISCSFSCDTSSGGGDSLTMWPSSVYSSPEPPSFKRPNCRMAGELAGDDEDGEHDLKHTGALPL